MPISSSTALAGATGASQRAIIEALLSAASFAAYRAIPAGLWSRYADNKLDGPVITLGAIMAGMDPNADVTHVHNAARPVAPAPCRPPEPPADLSGTSPAPLPADAPRAVTEARRGYPADVRALAVAMKAGRATNNAIAAAIRERLGHAPDPKSLTRLIRGWATKPRGPLMGHCR